ncbi:MAG TPA: inositol phosphorylceramide synthase [Thermoplasmatales archaeon]|nr:inositol phosphorylceramide synthase [Thermoplasmatales archaeon]
MKLSIVLLTANIFLLLSGIFIFRENRVKKLKYDDISHLLIFGILFLAVSALFFTGVKIDPIISSRFGFDFTRAIYNIEGDIVSAFQTIRIAPLDYYFAFVYMIGFPFMVYFTPVLYIISKDIKSFKFAVIGYAIAIAISLPFLLFFPVHDTWWASQNYGWYEGRTIYFRLQEIWPSIIGIFFKFTTINNCFPSLHSCLSAVMAYTAWIRDYKRYKYVAVLMAVSIPIATLYLGIHWFTDIIAGEAIALISVVLSMRISGLKWK